MKHVKEPMKTVHFAPFRIGKRLILRGIATKKAMGEIN